MANEKIAIAALKKGDSRGLNTIIRLYQDKVYGIIHNILKNQDDALEAAQDTFIKVFHAINTYQEESSFGGWIYRIAYNTGLDYARKVKSIRNNKDNYTKITQPTEFIHDNPLTQLMTSDRKDFVEKALNELPTEELTLIKLYYYKELSLAEIALIFDLTESNVKIKLYRIRKKLFDSIHLSNFVYN